MAPSPVPVLIVLGLYTVMFGLITDSGFETDRPPEIEEPESGGLFGAVDALLAVVQGVFRFLEYLFDAATFNVDGAPGWVRAIVSGIFTPALFWSAVTLFRGN